VTHNDVVIHPGVNYDDMAWYEGVPMAMDEVQPPLVKDNSKSDGYQ
jgi:hypothetical protein